MSEHNAEIDRPWRDDPEWVTADGHACIGDDCPGCAAARARVTPSDVTRHHTVADTLAAEDRVRAEDGHIGGRL